MYDDYELTFEDIAQKMKFSIKDFLSKCDQICINGKLLFLCSDESFTSRHYNIQTLYIELYKVYHSLSYTISSDLLTWNSNLYNLLSKSNFVAPQVRIVLKGSNSIKY